MISTGGSIEGGFLTGRPLYYPVFLITLLFFLWVSLSSAFFEDLLTCERAFPTAFSMS